MRAAILNEPNTPLELADDVMLEPPGPGQVRVRVVACGICHSDISLVNGTFPLFGPTVPGPRGCRSGGGARRRAWSRWRSGDHVVLSPNPACGRCRSCRRGRPGACERTLGLMTSTFGDGTTKLSRGGEVIYRGVGLAGWAEEVVVEAEGAIADTRRHPPRRGVRDRLRGADRGGGRHQHRIDRTRRLRAGRRSGWDRGLHRRGRGHRGRQPRDRVRSLASRDASRPWPSAPPR